MSRKDVNDEQIISALLACPSVEAAASSLSISPRTIFRRLEDTFFQILLADALDGVRKAREARSLALVDTAFETLQETMRDESAPPSVRVRAADVALGRFWKR